MKLQQVKVKKLKVQDVKFPHEYVDIDRAGDPPFLKSFIKSIKEAGILSPIFVTKDMRVRDGRTRAIAAYRAGLKEIPAMVMDDEAMYKALLKSNAGRKKR